MFAPNCNRLRLQAHEYAWAGFLLLGCVEIGRAVSHGTAPPVAMAWPLFMIGMATAIWAIRQPGIWRQRLGWAYYPLSMNLAYMALGPIVKAATDWRADAVLQKLDALLVGKNVSLRMEPLVSGPLCDAFSIGYLSFLVVLPMFYMAYLIKGRDLSRCFRGLFLLYGIGYSGYILVPAAGPYVAMAAQFHVALHGSGITTFMLHVTHEGSNHVDVFPSLHIAVSIYMWLTLLKDYRRIGLISTPLMLLLWVSTIYLRFHYAVDILCGAALAVVCFRFATGFSTTALSPRTSRHDHPAF